MSDANTKTTPLQGEVKTTTTPVVATPKPKMLVRSCRVKLSKDSCVPLKEVTPAEACLLTAEHHKNVGDSPIHDLGPVTRTKSEKVMVDGKHVDTKVSSSEITEIERTVTEEVDRLKNKYGAKKVAALFPGAIPTLPQTFEEAIKVGISVVLPDQKLGLGEVKL